VPLSPSALARASESGWSAEVRGAFYPSCGDTPRGERRSSRQVPQYSAEASTPSWHAPCTGRSVFCSKTDRPRTELFVVDSSPAAALALGAHRSNEESTYVLCRAAVEPGPAFNERVLKRARQIQARWSIDSLWYVIGSKPVEPPGSIRLLQELLPLLERGSSVTLATPRSFGPVVFGWVDSLLSQRGDDVNMGVRFYPDITALRRSAVSSVPNEQAHDQQRCA
jgi:hypothetical protein